MALPGVSFRESLAGHNDAFASLLDLIPARFYLRAGDEENAVIDSKYQKNKRSPSQKQKDAAERKSLSRAAKRVKLDADNTKGVQQMQEERRAAAENEEWEDESEEVDDEDVEHDGHVMDVVSGDQLMEAADGEKIGAAAAASVPARRVSVSELRERLHSKIAQLHQKRNPQETAAPGGVPSTKQELMEERRRQRGEMRDRRRNARKEARRLARAQPGAKGRNAAATGASRQPGLPVDEGKAVSRAQTRASDGTNVPESRLTFNQVSFGTGAAPEAQRRNKYALPSDPKAALAALEARKRKEEARIQKQLSGGQDEAQAREAAGESERWGKAMAAAQGVRIRDNEQLLKQTIKRREKTKAKSTKAWGERRHAEHDAQAAKQKKRMENLAARREGKHGKAGKKGAGAKARPGFEGTSRSFGAASRKRSAGARAPKR
ncbi:hypothetical protein MSPP1_001278 [Malassezia sp. CBS 17886]|nr:hypothetical protein MSPP1_001278 [Malassezia sp. CBS 17886]